MDPITFAQQYGQRYTDPNAAVDREINLTVVTDQPQLLPAGTRFIFVNGQTNNIGDYPVIQGCGVHRAAKDINFPDVAFAFYLLLQKDPRLQRWVEGNRVYNGDIQDTMLKNYFTSFLIRDEYLSQDPRWRNDVPATPVIAIRLSYHGRWYLHADPISRYMSGGGFGSGQLYSEWLKQNYP